MHDLNTLSHLDLSLFLNVAVVTVRLEITVRTVKNCWTVVWKV